MVHQLFVLHEAPPTEVAGAGAPGDGSSPGAGVVAEQSSVRPELVLVLGRRVRLTRDRGGGLRKSEHVRSACYLAGIVYIEKYRNAATLQKPIPIWFVFPQDLHKNEWPRN